MHCGAGPVTLNSDSTISLDAGTRLILTGNIDDASNPSAAGSDLVKLGDGELVLEGNNSYRGNTYVGAGLAAQLPRCARRCTLARRAVVRDVRHDRDVRSLTQL